MSAELVAVWSDTRPKFTEVRYRLSRDGSQYSVERCEHDLLGGERWVKTNDWNAGAASGEAGTLAILTVLIEKQALEIRTAYVNGYMECRAKVVG